MDRLPDELFLAIAAQLDTSDRNNDLISLCLVSQRWHGIAQEFLLKRPRFHISYLLHYMWNLAAHAHLIPQVRCLEMRSKSEGRVQRNEAGRAVREYKAIQAPEYFQQNTGLWEQCREVISKFAKNNDDAICWEYALLHDVIPALFGILICVLPNLVELKVGSAWMLDFHIFSAILSSDMPTLDPRAWRQSFMQAPVKLLYQRLSVLELPAEMTAMFFSRWNPAVFDFRSFVNLRELSFTMASLYNGTHGFLVLRTPDPLDILPASLEILRISEANVQTASFLQLLCTARKEGYYLALTRVEIYYTYYLEHYIHRTTRAPTQSSSTALLDSLHDMFADAKLELYLYFPSNIYTTWVQGETPWRLKREGRLSSEIGTFQVEWDKDGNAVRLVDNDGDTIMT